MTKTEQLLDYSVEVQMMIARLANTQVRNFDKLLEANQKELRDYLVTITYPVRRASVEAKVEGILAKYHSELVQSLQELSDEIALFAADSEVEALAVTKRGADNPGKSAVYEAVRNQLFQGASMAEWVNQHTRNDRDTVLRTVRTQMSYGMSGRKIAQAVLDVKRRQGARSQSFRGLALLVRSAVLHAFSAGRDAVWSKNKVLMQRLLWVSVLDTHTSETCRFLDGKTFKVGQGPRPPGHLNCRSVMVPLLIGDKIPRKQNWFGWLQSQPESVQKEALGATRYNLWKDAGIKPEKFYDEEGHQYTLAELRSKMPAAFRRLQNDSAE